jgi:hypothetical protein
LVMVPPLTTSSTWTGPHRVEATDPVTVFTVLARGFAAGAVLGVAVPPEALPVEPVPLPAPDAWSDPELPVLADPVSKELLTTPPDSSDAVVEAAIGPDVEVL